MAVAHSLRVSIVVITIPFALTYSGIPLEGDAYRPTVPFNIWILVPWLAFGFLLGEVSERLTKLTQRLLIDSDFFRRRSHYEWYSTFRRAALDDGLRTTHVRPCSRCPV